MRLDLEDDREPVADVDRAGVLARPLQDVRALSRKLPEQCLRRLVGAMLAPERPEHAELEVVGIAADGANDGSVLVGVERHRGQRGPVNDGRH